MTLRDKIEASNARAMRDAEQRFQASKVIASVLSRHGGGGTYADAAHALHAAGLLVTPAHDAAVAAKALREFGPEMQEEFACDPEVECPEGTCTNCDLLFAVQSTAAERADRIEHEGGDDV